MPKILNQQIYFEQCGSGEPALFLHGVPDSAEIWRKVLPSVSEHFSCFAIDLPGFYRSELPKDFSFTFDGYADFVEQVVIALGIEQPLTLVAHDWGGIFAMVWAIKYPHRVKRIVACNFPFGSNYQWHTWARIWRTPVLGELAMWSMNAHLFAREIKRGSLHISNQEIADTYKCVMSNSQTKATILRLYRSANENAFAAYEKGLLALAAQVDIDILWGEHDPYVAPAYGEAIPSDSFTLIKGSGHWLPLEQANSVATSLLFP